MDNNKIKDLIESIKTDKENIATTFFQTAYGSLSEKIAEKKKEIAKTLFRKKDSE